MDTTNNMLFADPDALEEYLKEDPLVEDIAKEVELLKEGVVPLPEDLQEAAERKLAGRRNAQVSFTSGGLLSKFAAQQRKLRRAQRGR